MESVYQPFAGLIPGVSGALLFWLTLAVVLVVIALVFWLKGGNLHVLPAKYISKSLNKLGTEMLSCVSVTDEVEGEFHFDHICLTSSGIIVVDIKDFRGLLFGGANTDQWTQVIGSRSYKFENPLYQNREKVQIIKSLVDDEVPVYGRVVFTDAGSFPKDQPEGVITQDSLDQDFDFNHKVKTKDVPANQDTVWQKLKTQVSATQHV